VAKEDYIWQSPKTPGQFLAWLEEHTENNPLPSWRGVRSYYLLWDENNYQFNLRVNSHIGLNPLRRMFYGRLEETESGCLIHGRIKMHQYLTADAPFWHVGLSLLTIAAFVFFLLEPTLKHGLLLGLVGLFFVLDLLTTYGIKMRSDQALLDFVLQAATYGTESAPLADPANES